MRRSIVAGLLRRAAATDRREQLLASVGVPLLSPHHPLRCNADASSAADCAHKNTDTLNADQRRDTITLCGYRRLRPHICVEQIHSCIGLHRT